jgi:nucleoside-diphosphate-sugar epimerase
VTAASPEKLPASKWPYSTGRSNTQSEDVAVGIAGFFSHQSAIGESFHITSDESHSWDRIFDEFAEATGATARIVHLQSESIARAISDWGQQLLGT